MNHSGSQRLESMYRLHAPAIARYLVRRGATIDDAADLVNEVFLTAAARLDALPSGDDEALPWLLVTARNHLWNLVRSRERARLAHEQLDAETTAPDCLAQMLNSQIPGNVYRALLELSESDRELLLLTGWDDLSPQQAAEILGLPRSAVRVRLHRARQRFDRAFTHMESNTVMKPRSAKSKKVLETS